MKGKYASTLLVPVLLLGAMERADADLDNRVQARLQTAVAEYCKDSRSRAIFMVKTGAAALSLNMVRNPGFEEIYDAPAERQGMPVGWGVNPQTKAMGGLIDTIKHAVEDGQFGWRSGRMRRVGTTGYYNTSVPGVAPGASYLVQAYVKLNRWDEGNLERAPNVSLQVRWWGKGWLCTDIYTTSMALTETGRWTLLETVVIPPDKATGAVTFLMVEELAGETEVLFDNLSFRQIKQ